MMQKVLLGIFCMIGMGGCLLDIERRPMDIPDTGESEGEVMDAEAEPPGDEVIPLCGNGLCDAVVGETCFNCPEDCLECACTTPDDCPEGRLCEDGHCLPGCDNDGECPAGQVCVGHVCVGEASLLCSNGVDDDGDGYIDCDDFDCSENGCVPFCLLEHDLPQCTDGVDNDMDGKIDCADEQCVFNLSVDACECGSGSGMECGGNEACSDGSDDDGDGYVDCDDSDCRRDPHVSVCGSENTDATCTDGIDNDGNGHTDCDDSLCMSTVSVTVCCDISGG